MSQVARMIVAVAFVLSAFATGGSARADAVGWGQDRGDASRSGGRVWWGDAPRGQVAWRVDVTDRSLGSAAPMVDASPVVGSGNEGTIYVGVIAGGVRLSRSLLVWPSLVAFNRDGTRKWAVRLESGGYHYKVRTAPAIRSDGSLVVVGYRTDVRSYGYYPMGRVFLVSRDGAVLKVSKEIQGAGLSAPLMVHETGDAYVFSHPINEDDFLWKFDWNFNMTGPYNAVHYELTGSCEYCIYDPDSIQAFFYRYTDDHHPDIRGLLPSPMLDTLNKEIVQPSVQTSRLRLSNLSKIWQKDVLGFPGGTVAMGVSYSPAYVKAVEARNRYGDKLWSYSDTSRGYFKAVALGKQHLYASEYGGSLASFTRSGQLRWQRTVGDPYTVGAPVVLRIGFDELIVVPGQSSLMAFRPDGSLVWVVPLDGPAFGSPAIADGRIYVTTQWSLYAIQ